MLVARGCTADLQVQANVAGSHDGGGGNNVISQEQAAWWSAQRITCRDMFSNRRHLTPADQQAATLAIHSHRAAATAAVNDATSTTASGTGGTAFCPALLWTFTGTGNTMTRMLVEVASGWFTGSVYTGAWWQRLLGQEENNPPLWLLAGMQIWLLSVRLIVEGPVPVVCRV